MPGRSVRAFLFDLDGVLVDSTSIIHRGWETFAAQRGVSVPSADYPRAIYGRRTREILIDYFGLREADADDLLARGFDDKSALVRDAGGLVEIPGASAFVRAAKAAGLKLAVASSASPANVTIALHAIGVAGLLDAVITSADVRAGKPAPDPYLAAADAVAVAPGEAVVFEDTAFGIQSARAAGARCVALATTLARDELTAADLVIDDFRGLQPDRLLEDLGA